MEPDVFLEPCTLATKDNPAGVNGLDLIGGLPVTTKNMDMIGNKKKFCYRDQPNLIRQKAVYTSSST